MTSHENAFARLYKTCRASNGSASRIGSAVRQTVHDGGVAVSSGDMARITQAVRDAWQTSGGSRAAFETNLKQRLGMEDGGRKFLTALSLLCTLQGGVAWAQYTQDVTTTVTGETVTTGNTQNVSNGGVADESIIELGAVQNVYDGGITVSTHINHDPATIPTHGKQHVYSGGVASASQIEGHQYIHDSGSAVGTLISGGVQFISSGGVASATVMSGVMGGQIIHGGGLAVDTILEADSGEQRIESGGVASRTVVSAGMQIAYQGGLAVDTTVSAGGTLAIWEGSASGATLSSGGLLGIGTSATLAGTNVLQDGARLSGNSGEVLTLAAGATLEFEVGNLSLADQQAFVNDTLLDPIEVEISGDGSLIKSGAETLTLTGINSYTGATTISDGALKFDQSGDQTLSGDISGAGSLVKEGTGTLILTGDVGHAGGTTIDGGTLQIGNGGALGSISGDIVNNDELVFDLSSDFDYSGTLSGSGNLTQAGSGKLTLSGDNTHTGNTNISDGTLEITGALGGGTHTGDISINLSATLTLNQASDQELSGNFAGDGFLVKTGSEKLTLSGNNNNYSGTLVVREGILAIGADDNIGQGTNILDGGTLEVSTGTYTRNWRIDAGGGAIDVSGGEVTMQGSLYGSGDFTKEGTDTLILSGDNSSYGGTLVVREGSLAIDADHNVGNQNRLDGGTLELAGNTTYTKDWQIGGSGGAIDVSSGDVTMQGALHGDGAFTKEGAGTLTLAGNNAYTGDMTISDGRLEIEGPLNYDPVWGDWNAYDGAITVGTSGIVRFNQTGSQTVTGNISGDGALVKDGSETLVLTGDVDITGVTVNDGTLQIGDSSGFGTITSDIENNAELVFYIEGGDLDYGSALSGSGNLVKDGWGGKLTLSGSNSYSGDTTVKAGTLSIDDDNKIGDGANTLDGGTLELTGAAYSRDWEIGGSGGAIDVLDNTVEMSGDLSGTGDFTKEGSGALTLSGNNDYGNTTINNGTLEITGTLGSADTYGGEINIAGGATLLFNQSADQTVTGGISGDGTLVKDGSETLTLSGNNTYTGDMTISEGTLEIQGALNYDSYWGDWNAYDGAITVGASGIVRFKQTGSQTVTGNISGDGALVKDGSETLTLSGDNSSYAGNITVSAGTLSIAADNNIGSGVNTLDGGTLELTGAAYSRDWEIGGNGGAIDVLDNTVEMSGDLSGTGAFTKEGSGMLVLTGDASHSGGTTIHAGILVIGNGSTSGSITGDIVNNAQLTFDLSSNFDYSDDLSGSGNLTQDGSGTLTLSGDNSYTGNTTIYNGTLEIQGTLGNAGTYGGEINIRNASSTLLFNQIADQTVSGGIYGDGTLVKDGSETLILTGNNTYTGGTTIDAGTLQIGDGGASGSISGDIVNNDELVFDLSSDFDYGGILSGGGNLTQAGSGTLTLSGSNSYSGNTTVSAGTLSIDADNKIGGGVNTLAGGTLELTGSAYGKDWTLSGTSNVIATPGDVDLSGALSDAGGFTKDGAGELTLSGINTYTGDTTIQSGRLTVTGLLGAGNYSGNIDNAAGAELTFNQNVAQNLNGILSGGGNLVKDGTGTLTLSGNNTYIGATTVKAGTLALSGSGTISRQLALYGGTRFDTGSNTVPLDRFEVHGPAQWINGTLDATAATMIFHLPATIQVGDTLLSGTGNTIELSGASAIEAHADASSLLGMNDGDTIALMSYTTRLDASDPATQVVLAGTHSATLRNTPFIAITPTSIDLTVRNTANPQGKSLSEGQLPALALARQGVDMAAGTGMAALQDALRTGRNSFVYLEGSSLRYKTGSHIDVDGTIVMAGLSGETNTAPGHLSFGAFVIHGRGDYDSYNSFPDAARVKGKGHTRYTGLGLLARLDATGTDAGHSYAETSLQGGQARSDFRSNDFEHVGSVKYDSRSDYQGAHLAAGHVWTLAGGRGELDLYGRLLYTRKGGDKVPLDIDGQGPDIRERIRFQATESKRFRIGGRYTWTHGTMHPYAGLAWEHEFDGKARARSEVVFGDGTTKSSRIKAPDMTGGAGIVELGLSVVPDKTGPLTVDLGLQGYAGKREGVSAKVKVEYRF